MSMLEMISGLAIGAILVTALATFLKQSSDTQSLLTLNDTITGLEQKIRAASRNSYSLESLTAEANPTFDSCLTATSSDCLSTWQPLGLFYIDGDPLDGSYDKNGRRCTDAKCYVSVATWFNGACFASGCTRLNVVYIRYEIKVKGNLLRSGLLTYSKENAPVSDDNETCGVDAKERPKFARKIDGGTVTCEEVPTPIVTVKGIKPGSCKRGKEVIVGVKIGGSIICEAAKYTPSP
jgi:hypothetical protein